MVSSWNNTGVIIHVTTDKIMDFCCVIHNGSHGTRIECILTTREILYRSYLMTSCPPYWNTNILMVHKSETRDIIDR